MSKAGYGSRKGGAYERKISRLLSLWLSEGKDSDLLWRSAGSGSVTTVGLKTGKVKKSHAGDISSISAEGYKLTDRVCLELKHYQQLGLINFFLGRPSKLTGFWKKHIQLSKSVDKIPVLIAKQNNVPDLLITTGEFVTLLDTSIFGKPNEVFYGTVIGNYNPPIIVYQLTGFLKTFKFKKDI
jgi:hypothetical protein